MSQAANLFSQDPHSHTDNEDPAALSMSSLLPLPANNNSSQAPADLDPFVTPPFLTPFCSPPHPLFYPPADPAPDVQVIPSGRRLRDGKYADLTEYQRKAIHAENNRRFAKESRERKRIYVETLEKEVQALRLELSWYKARFAAYSLIDQKRDLRGEEWPNTVLAALEESRTDPGQFGKILIRKLDEQFDERKRALEQLFRIALEIAVPLSLRYHMWKLENHIDIFNPKDMCRLVGYGPESDQVNSHLAHIRQAHPECEEIERDMKAKLTEKLHKIKQNVRQMLGCQKAIQTDTLRILNHMKQYLESKYTAGLAVDDLHFVRLLNNRPELSDASVLQVTDEDFWPDTAAPASDDEAVLETGSKVGLKAGDKNKVTNGSIGIH